MSSGSITEDAIGCFTNFVHRTPSSGFAGIELACLAGYIQAWVRSGDGARVCQGDFQTFLIAVPGIINYCLRNSSALNYEPLDAEGNVDETRVVARRVDQIFMDDYAVNHPILDSHFFAVCTFNELHGDRD